MKYPALMACLATLALTGCKTMPLASPPVVLVPPIEASMAEADNWVRANQRDKAISVLEKAAAQHPTKPEPMLRVAQMHYDRADYGEAITFARKALEREPSNLLANSILAVSGLRVSTQALSDLAERNNISGPVRSEAEDLAKLIRTSLGEDVLVPVRQGSTRSATTRPAPKRPSSRNTASDDPFGALK